MSVLSLATVTPDVPEPLLNVSEMAVLLHMDERAIYRLRASGALPTPLKIGRKLRWRRRDVAQWMASQQEGAGDGVA